MSGVEAAGDVLTGAVIGGAIEPGHGEATGDGHGNCANCGAALQGGYCHVCGQNAHVHRSIGGIGHEIAHGVFHFEGKIWRTLPLLAFKPGQLTRRYTHGERARFVSPLALFLFAVFLTFAVFETVGGPISSGGNGGINLNLGEKITAQKAAIAKLQQERATLIGRKGDVTAIDAKLAEERSDLAGMTKASSFWDGSATPDADDFKIETKWAWIDSHFREAKKNPRLLLYKLQASAYKYAWALIVLSLPFMWLVFPFRRDVRLYDHAIFVTYSLSSLMLMLIVAVIVSALTGIGVGWTSVAFPIHLFVQLRGAYQLGWIGAAWRTAVLLFASLIVLTAFAALLLFLGLLG